MPRFVVEIVVVDIHGWKAEINKPDVDQYLRVNDNLGTKLKTSKKIQASNFSNYLNLHTHTDSHIQAK